jgi:hypothetical protein
MPKRPKATRFAAIEDSSKVPLHDAVAHQGYQRFLAAGLPRAFALSPDGRAWSFKAGGLDSINLALSHCAQAAK